MFKKIILSVLVILTMCSTAIPAQADDNVPDGIDINGIPPIPHRAPRRPVATISSYLDTSTNSLFIVFNREVSDVTIKVYYDGLLEHEYYYKTLSTGDYEVVGLDFSAGIYTIEVTSNGNTLYNNTIDYTGEN